MSPAVDHPRRPSAIRWSWGHALAGAVFALPAAVVTLSDPARGIPLAVGVLPAAMIGIPAARRQRLSIAIVGSLAGLSIFVGGLIAHLPIYATAALLVLAVIGAALLAARLPAGRIVLALCVPMVGAGLSYGDFATSVATLALLVVGSAYAWAVSLLWPARTAPERPQQPMPPRAAMLDYGIRLGLAAAVVYVIAAGLGLDHPGWAPAACLLVARPQLDLLQSRGVGRVLSVTAGAVTAALLLHADASNAVLAVVALAALAAASGTAGSRWYVTSAFTTLLVFLMLLYGNLADAPSKFHERVGETVLGVAAAYLFGWAVPALRQRLRGPAPHETPTERL